MLPWTPRTLGSFNYCKDSLGFLSVKNDRKPIQTSLNHKESFCSKELNRPKTWVTLNTVKYKSSNMSSGDFLSNMLFSCSPWRGRHPQEGLCTKHERQPAALPGLSLFTAAFGKKRAAPYPPATTANSSKDSDWLLTRPFLSQSLQQGQQGHRLVSPTKSTWREGGEFPEGSDSFQAEYITKEELNTFY